MYCSKHTNDFVIVMFSPPIHACPLCKAQRELQVAEDENLRLKKELQLLNPDAVEDTAPAEE
jgi:predicted metal-binding transcription factor (methanogenesis marker protein 9)